MTEGVPLICERGQIGGREIMSLRMFASHIFLLIQYLVHKLLAIIIGFFVGFVKIFPLFTMSVLRNYT